MICCIKNITNLRKVRRLIHVSIIINELNHVISLRWPIGAIIRKNIISAPEIAYYVYLDQTCNYLWPTDITSGPRDTYFEHKDNRHIRRLL